MSRKQKYNKPIRPAHPPVYNPQAMGAGGADKALNRFSPNEAVLVPGLLIFFYALSVIWGLWSSGTWDDDCVGRYFNTLKAINDPMQLIDLWNRPLWVAIFMFPVHLGKWVIPVIMSAFAVTGAYFLYRYLRERNVSNAYLVIPIYLIQPFFFGVARDAMTEPLAACLICLGLFFMVKRQFLLFALAGALMPLARLELVALLPFWLVVLVVNKQWKHILMLGVGVLMLAATGAIIKGDVMWLADILLKGESTENRYGHQKFSTYLERYYYVLGPPVFFFLGIGLVNRFKTFFFPKIEKPDYFILLQFLWGFFVYTLFAWKLNVGNSAGFLRNLTPLTPFVAVIALYGFNDWVKYLGDKKGRAFLMFYAFLFPLVVYQYFRYKLLLHHSISTEIDSFGLAVAMVLPIATYLFALVKLFQPGPLAHKTVFTLATACAVLMTGYTLITEPPSVSISPKRAAVNQVAALYETCDMQRFTTRCSQAWFLWILDLNRNKEMYNDRMTREVLLKDPDSTVVIWDSFNSNKRKNNVDQAFFAEHANKFTELFRLSSSDNRFNTVVYWKVPPGSPEILDVYEKMLEEYDDLAAVYTGRANYWLQQNNVEEARKDFDKAVRLKSADAYTYYSAAEYLAKKSNYDNAIDYYNLSISKNGSYPASYFARGNAHFYKGNLKQAKADYTAAITLQNNFSQAYFNRALASLRLNEKDAGCKDLEKARSLGFAAAQQSIDTYCR